MEGTRISHYEVVRLLGRGGMGEVYEAVDLDLGRRVALKFVAPELAADAASLRRFEHEATNAARLSHPNIARVFAFHRDTRPPFIDMELVPGGSLRQRLEAGPLPVGEALAIARDVASALAHAHRKDVVHRDIKPENLMFGEEGEVKVMDFGLARALHASRLTMTGIAVGTAAYMAPEAIRGAVGSPADVFALGVVLHEMLAGSLPFAGENAFALMYTIANTEPRRVRAARPDAPEAAEELVLQMLEKDPARRPEAVQVARILGGLVGVAPPADSGVLEPAVVRMPAAAPASPEALASAPTMPMALARRGARRGPRPALVAAVLIAVAGLVVAGAASLRRWDAARKREALVLSNRGLELLQRRDLDGARARFEEALARDPGFGPAMLNLGRVLHERGQEAQAESLYRQVLRTSAHDVRVRAMAYSQLADLDLAAGAWAAAVANLERSFALDSSDARPYNQLGWGLLVAGRAGDALALLDRGIARFPTVAPLRKNAGLAALVLGDAARARREADAALGIAPGYAAALALRARARARGGDLAGARADLAAYLGSAPLDSLERDATVRDLADRGVAPESAPDRRPVVPGRPASGPPAR